MDQWIVRYTYRGSVYFDSPLRVSRGYMSFASYDDARAWADGEHPDLPDYQTQAVYLQKEIIPKVRTAPRGSAEAYHASDRNTDACILAGNRRFR